MPTAPALKHSSVEGDDMIERLLLGIWALLLITSVCALTFYRSRAGHGPDVVAKEMGATLLPTCLAFLVALILCFIPSNDGIQWHLAAGTFLFGLVEVAIYCYFIM